jgi:ABC-type branched-subunit amino acid transport system substrate-binding protein
MFGRRLPVALMLLGALLFVACGDDDEPSGGGDGTTSTTAGELTDSFRGVTAESIKVGIVIVDYDAIADFVDFARGDQQAIAQVFVDDINENGGVLGRQIEPVYKLYPPIPGQEPSPLAVCTSLTEDEEVFAVLGVFIDFTGEGQLCLSRDHETIHIGHELEQPWIDDSPPGLMLTPDSTKEGQAQVVLNLLEQEGTLEGRTVGVLADQDSEGRVNDVIVPGLEGIGVEVGSQAILSISGTDTSAAQSQLDSFIERWKTEDVDTVFMAGLTASAKQFVEKVKAELPDVLLITDADATAQQAQDEVAAGKGPDDNPYEGMIGATGETASERWNNKSPLLQDCVDTYEAASGETVVGPDDLQPDANGKTQEIYVAVTDFCGELQMFKEIAERAGVNLTNETWQAAVDEFGAIDLASTGIASLCEGKYAADDSSRLVEFDSTIGEQGDWAPITEVGDASGGRCTS